MILTIIDNNDSISTCSSIVTVNGSNPTCSVSSSANTGGTVIGSATTYAATNQMFLGYGAQSMNMSCSASGGSSYTYNWSGAGLSNSNISNPIFTPTGPGNYTLTCTVTNNYGCRTSCEIEICVIDARGSGGSNNNPKVAICHIPSNNSGNSQTLNLSVNAVASHLGSHGGCRLGA